VSDVYVFLGPTLPVTAARAELDATYLPPVSKGDIYRLWARRPRVIGIIDVYFERVPAVWHKEILWIMERGVHVFGAAGGGALRAVELESFGMRGVGAVYQAFKDGTLEQDDEVAVAHGLSSAGYRALSEAMVNVRQTLLAARDAQTISECTREHVEATAKALFYQRRTWPNILAEAGTASDIYASDLVALRKWLPLGKIDQLAADAAAMLRDVRGFLADNPQPKRVAWTTANTALWNEARQQATSVPGDGPDESAVALDAVIDEIRLLGPEMFQDSRRRCLLRLFASDVASREGLIVDGEWLGMTSHEFRADRGIEDDADFKAHLARNDLSVTEFEQMMEVETKVGWACERAEHRAFENLLHDLRIRGDYERLVTRARDKAGALSARGYGSRFAESRPAQDGSTERELLRWYFCDQLGTAVPTDLAGYARSSGFVDERALLAAIWREFCYVTDRRVK